MIETSDEDLKLDSAFQSWSTGDCAPDFASSVVRQALSERVVTFPSGRRPVLVPLLMVACLLSAGAWARFGVQIKPFQGAAQADAQHDRAPPAASPLSFQLVSATAHAEKEPHVEAPAPSSASSNRKPLSLTHLDPPQESPPPERPQQVHLPHCECGTSAVVCSCYE